MLKILKDCDENYNKVIHLLFYLIYFSRSKQELDEKFDDYIL